jgi:hypothetical protein
MGLIAVDILLLLLLSSFEVHIYNNNNNNRYSPQNGISIVNILFSSHILMITLIFNGIIINYCEINCLI